MFADYVCTDTLINRNRVPRYFGLLARASWIQSSDSISYNRKMPHTQQIHAGDPAYASPVIRPPSPASSVGTAYGPDDTSLSDSGLSQDVFEQKWIANLRLDEPKHDEIHNLKDPLIICPSDPQEQKRELNILVPLYHLLITPGSAV
jgi:hypothetical protein